MKGLLGWFLGYFSVLIVVYARLELFVGLPGKASEGS